MSSPTADPPLLDLRYQAIEAGMTFGPMELQVTEHLVKAFAFAVDDYAPLTRTDETVEATLLVPDLLRLLNCRFDPNTMIGLHQKEEVFLYSRVRIGETATLSGRCIAKYAKRGKGCFEMEADARSAEDNRLLVRHRSVEIAELDPALQTSAGTEEPGRRVSGVLREGAGPIEHAAEALVVGTPVVPLSKQVHQDQIAVFSNAGRFWRNIHTDLDQAREAGHDRTLAQGLMQTMYVAQLGAQFFGEPWSTSGRIWNAYLKPLLEGETVTINAVVGDRSTNGRRLELETWVETEHGVRTTVGWLSAEVDG